MISIRYPSASATFIREAMKLPIPQKWVDEVLALDDLELAAASGSTPAYEVGGGAKLANIDLRARQEAFVLARLRRIHAIEVCRVAGLDPNDVEDRVSLDGLEFKANDVDAAGNAKAITSMAERDALLLLERHATALLGDLNRALHSYESEGGPSELHTARTIRNEITASANFVADSLALVKTAREA